MGERRPCVGAADFRRQEAPQVRAVSALHERLGEGGERRIVDPAGPPGDLLDAADLEALAVLDDPHELGGLHHRLERAGVEPRRAAVEHLTLSAPRRGSAR